MCFLLLSCNKRINNDSTIAATIVSNEKQNRIIFNYHNENIGTNVDSIYFMAVTYHEIWHTFKLLGLIDMDIPTAAALGYYHEYRLSGKILDETKNHLFNKGLIEENVEFETNKIINKYISKKEITEDAESYNDGAFLAGMVYNQFEKNLNGDRYLMLISSRLDHNSALFALKENIQGIILRYRMGLYFIVDEKSLEEDIGKFSLKGQDAIRHYISELANHYKIGMVPDKENIIEMFGVGEEK